MFVVAILLASGAWLGIYWVAYDELPPPIPHEPSEVRRQLEQFSVDTELLFAYNSSVLQTEAVSHLDAVAVYLAEFPEYPIIIAGHADSTGGEEFNQGLSERRAQAVVDYLVDAGTTNEMTPVGFGESQPVKSNASDAGKAANRRVSFSVGE